MTRSLDQSVRSFREKLIEEVSKSPDLMSEERILQIANEAFSDLSPAQITEAIRTFKLHSDDWCNADEKLGPQRDVVLHLLDRSASETRLPAVLRFFSAQEDLRPPRELAREAVDRLLQIRSVATPVDGRPSRRETAPSVRPTTAEALHIVRSEIAEVRLARSTRGHHISIRTHGAPVEAERIVESCRKLLGRTFDWVPIEIVGERYPEIRVEVLEEARTFIEEHLLPARGTDVELVKRVGHEIQVYFSENADKQTILLSWAAALEFEGWPDVRLTGFDADGS